MMYPLVLDLAADGIPIAMTRRVLRLTPQAFYRWRKNPVSRRDGEAAHLINAVLGIHHDDPAFGYRFIADELPERGIVAGRNQAARLCSTQRVWSVLAKKKGLTRWAGPPVHDDPVREVFIADAANRLWLTDVTEHRTGEDKLYLCAIEYVYLGRIVGYSIGDRMKKSLAVTAVRDAIRLRDPAGRIVHSDRGSQSRSRKFVNGLRHNGLIGCIGRVGACGGNAATESAFALLRKTALDRQRRVTRQELRLAIVTWAEQATTTADANDASNGSHPSTLRQSTGPHTRPEPLTPASQPNPGQSLLPSRRGR
jgi:putative transposase